SPNNWTKSYSYRSSIDEQNPGFGLKFSPSKYPLYKTDGLLQLFIVSFLLNANTKILFSITYTAKQDIYCYVIAHLTSHPFPVFLAITSSLPDWISNNFLRNVKSLDAWPLTSTISSCPSM